MPQAYGIGGLINVPQGAVTGVGAPPASFKGQLGQQYFDTSVSPPSEYTFNGQTWQSGGNAYATTTAAGIVELATAAEMAAGTSTTLVPPVKEVFDYVNAQVIAGAPVSTEVTAGIGQLATNAEAVAGTASTPLLALFITPSNLTSVFAAPPAIGGTTPAAGAFTNVSATGVGTGNILTSDTASSFSTTGAGVDVTIASAAGRVIINGEEAADNAVTLVSAAGGLDVAVALEIGIVTTEANADSINMTSAGGIDITATGAAGKDIDIVCTSGSVNLTAGETIASSMVFTNNGMQVVTSGAAARDITMTNTGGSIALSASEAVADAINIDATAGGIDVDAVGQVNIASSQNAADSIVITSSVGGIDILAAGAAAGEDIDIIATGSSVNIESTEDAALAVYLHANGGTSETIRLRADQGTGVASIDVLSDVGGITLTAGVASADAINLLTSNAAGGIDIDSGTNGFIVDTTGAISLDSAAASNFTVTGAFDLSLISSLGSVNVTAGEDAADAIVLSAGAGGIDILATGAAGQDIDIINTGGSVNITATENVAEAIYIRANGGTSETIRVHADQGTGVASINLGSDVGGITLTGGLGTADAINIVSSNAAGGIDVDAGTGGFIVDSTGAFSIDGAAASNVTVTGAGIDLTLASVLGSVLVSSTEDAALAIRLYANGGTSETIQLHADQGTGVGSVNLLSDVGGITLRATGLASADAINLEAPAGGLDVDVALQMNLTSSQAAASAIVINASNAAGGIDLTTGGGSIDLSSAGFATVVAATDTQGSPSATAVINANVGRATFTGFTTAAAGSQVFVITNSIVTTASCVLVTVCNEGANDAQMTVQRVTRAAGSLSVTCKNNGAAALNGNVAVNFWVLTA